MADTPTETRITVAGLAVDLKYIRAKIDEMCDQGKEHDQRLDKVERITWAITSVSGLMAAIFVPIAIAAVKKWLQL